MTDELYIQLLRAIRAHSGMDLDSIREAGEYGADKGWPGFTYYDDTSEFYDANAGAIRQALQEGASEYGHDSVPAFVATFVRADLADNRTGFECLCAWYVLESVGRHYADRRDGR